MTDTVRAFRAAEAAYDRRPSAAEAACLRGGAPALAEQCREAGWLDGAGALTDLGRHALAHAAALHPEGS